MVIKKFTNSELLQLRDLILRHGSRKMSIEEKRKLGVALTRLSPEDLSKALEIVAQNNPGFEAAAEEVDLDIDAQVFYYYYFFLSYSFQVLSIFHFGHILPKMFCG